jgi:sec-independent protein translocase protein TatB
MMKRVSFSETIFLFFLALIVFGPKKLPEIARYVGKMLNEFRRASNEFKSQIEQEIAHLEVETKKQTILPPSPPPAGTASRTLDGVPVDTSPTKEAPPTAEPATLAASTDNASTDASARDTSGGTADHASQPVAVTEAIPASEAMSSSSSFQESDEKSQQESHV